MLIYTGDDQLYNNSQELNLRKTQSTDVIKLDTLKSAIKTLSTCHTRISKQKDLNLQLFTKYSFENDDFEAHCITVMKYLIRNLEPTGLDTLFNASQNDFPILNILLRYSHHSDIMIQNAARISLMTFFKNCSGDALEYITWKTIPQHITDIIAQLKQYALDIQHFYEKFNGNALGKKYLCFKEELEYVDDILSLDFCISKTVTSMLFNEFIVPFILTSITYEQNTVHSSPISCKIGLYLFSKLLKIITDTKIKDYIVSFFLMQETSKEIEVCPNNKSINQMIQSLHLTLNKYELDFDKLYTLQILNIFQFYASEDSIKSLKFYSKFLNTLMKTVMQYNSFSNHALEYIKFKLLTTILEPLSDKTVIVDRRWSFLYTYVTQFLEILYINISMKIKQEISDLEMVIDEEYEKFINLKIDSDRILEDVNYLIHTNNYKNFSATIHNIKSTLWNLFFIRKLDLKLKNEKENILPILKRKEEIGKILRIDNHSIPCEKLTHGNHYKNKHFFKFTDRQLLILQSTQIQCEGLVVFNPYYKDIVWSMDVNNILKLYEMQKYYQFQRKKISKPISIQLKLSSEDTNVIQNILLKAKSRQIKIINNKLKNLLCD